MYEDMRKLAKRRINRARKNCTDLERRKNLIYEIGKRVKLSEYL